MNFCKCGCGEAVKWNYKRGHTARILNVSKREDVKEKKKIKHIQKIETGYEFSKGWKKGLTIDDPRIRKSIDVMISKRLENKTWLVNVKASMKKNRNTGIGENSSNWKGGKSSLQQLLRGSSSNGRFYKQWTRKILERDYFSCRICFNSKNLNVHHDKQTMSEIIQMFTKNVHLDKISFTEKKNIVDDIIDYHILNDVSGICLCRDCHREIHKKHI